MSDEFSPRRDRGERSDRGDRGERSGGGGFGGFRGRRKSCPFSSKGAPKIDYKDVRLLQRFVSERGKIMPSRITAVSAKHQRALTQAIKRARFLALLPYADKKSGG
jgi:small subunit ribosomal protein S18